MANRENEYFIHEKYEIFHSCWILSVPSMNLVNILKTFTVYVHVEYSSKECIGVWCFLSSSHAYHAILNFQDCQILEVLLFCLLLLFCIDKRPKWLLSLGIHVVWNEMSAEHYFQCIWHGIGHCHVVKYRCRTVFQGWVRLMLRLVALPLKARQDGMLQRYKVITSNNNNTSSFVYTKSGS